MQGGDKIQAFIATWKEINASFISTPRFLRRAQQLITFPMYNPQAQSPDYLLSPEFWHNLEQGNLYEIIVTTVLGLATIFGLCGLCCLYKLIKCMCPSEMPVSYTHLTLPTKRIV